MAFIQQRRVETGQLISGTFHELGGSAKAVAIYFAVFLGLGILADLVAVTRPIIAVLATLIYFAAQYFLYRELLEKAGIVYDRRAKVFSFFIMAILLGIPLNLAFTLLVIPGILLAAKWIMAPTYLVAEELNLFEAIGASWRASSNNLVSLSLAFTVIGLIWLAIYFLMIGAGQLWIWAIGIDSQARDQLDGFGWVGMHALPVLLMGLSVSAYRSLSDNSDSLAAVFE